MLSKNLRYLFLIIFLGAVLRFAYLSYSPPSLNWDEVSHGYNAYSILTTGKDEWGEKFPLIFRAYGDYKLPVYIYLTSISEKLFGLNEFSVRFISAISGVGTVIFTFLLASELFASSFVATLSAFFVAVEPWGLFLSRGALEGNLSLFFITSGVFYFIKGLKNKIFYIPFAFLMGLSVWTYNSARVFAPLLVTALILIYRKEIFLSVKNKIVFLVIPTILISLFFIPMFIQLARPIGQARYSKVAILDSGAIAKIEEARNKSDMPLILNKLVNNKIVYFVKIFSKNWLSHFSLDFLFAKGGSNYQFSIPGKGLIYWTEFVPFIFGIFWLFLRKEKSSYLVLFWLLFSPIPSALTNEAPHVLRVITMLPMPMVVSALGLNWITGKIPKKFRFYFLLIYITLVLGFLENYLINYFVSYRNNYSFSWQYGYKEVMNYIKDNYSSYDKIIITKKYGEPHEFLLFYLKWNPLEYNSDPNLIRFYQSGWYWVDRFDKFYFVNDWQVREMKLESGGNVDCNQVKCLLITSPGNYPNNWKKLSTINFLDGKPAFEVLDNK